MLSTAGDTHLGGDDFDRALLDVWLRQTNNEYDALEDVQLAWKRAEEAKRVLSDSDSVTLVLEVGGQSFRRRLNERYGTRNQLFWTKYDAIRLALSDANLALQV